LATFFVALVLEAADEARFFAVFFVALALAVNDVARFFATFRAFDAFFVADATRFLATVFVALALLVADDTPFAAAFFAVAAFLEAVATFFFAAFFAVVAFLVPDATCFFTTFFALVTLFASAFLVAAVFSSMRSAVLELLTTAVASVKPCSTLKPAADTAASMVPMVLPTNFAALSNLFVIGRSVVTYATAPTGARKQRFSRLQRAAR